MTPIARPKFRLEAPPPSSDLFHAAKALGDSESKNLGLLPHAAWDDYAAAGHILVAVEGTELLGYVAYRVPRNEVRLAHLVVKPSARNKGVARALIGEISSLHHERRGIGLRCRRDWDANNVWPELGFVSVGEREGRGAERLPLTEWWHDFGHPDLLSWAPGDSIVTAAIDCNVFIDLHGSSPGSQAQRTRELIESLSDRVDLVVTPELLNELNRQPDAGERTRLIQIAQTYPTVRVPSGDVDKTVKGLLSRSGYAPKSDQDRSDVRHVAWAGTTGVPVLITRDQPARRRLSDAAFEEVDVTICTPSTLVAVVHEREEAGAYAPAALAATEFGMQDVSSNPDAAREFLDSSRGERRNEFDRRTDDVSAGRPASRLTLVRNALDEPTALVGAVADGSSLRVLLARLHSGPLASTLAAQLIETLRSVAGELNCSSIVMADPHVSGDILKASQSDGFVRGDDNHDVALSVSARVRVNELAPALDRALEGLSPKSAGALRHLADTLLQSSPAALEHAFRPLRLLDAELPTWLVPIKPQWASDLFGYPAMLVPRSNSLGLSTEHVYYKGGKAGEGAPGRILWYASSPIRQVFGCSLLVAVRDGTPKDMYRTYQRLGVYAYAHVDAIKGKTGQVRALNVTGTEVFPRPISLDRLRTLADGTGDKLNLVTSKKVSTNLFTAVIQQGFRDVS